MGTVLIVDDVEDIQFSLSNIVRKMGHTVITASTGKEALEELDANIIDLIFLDIGLPDGDGIELISSLKAISVDVDIVMLTGLNYAKAAVDSLKAGAVDYIVKPFDVAVFKETLNKIMQARLMGKTFLLAAQSAPDNPFICSSKEMLPVKEAIEVASDVSSPVLITGETGTGKELVARAVHYAKPKKNGVFVKVDCSTLSTDLIASELFGYHKGAFTDAHEDKKGLVEVASGGTLFLDEIGNLPLQLQPKLLRLIEESTFRKVGGVKDIRVSVRIIAATNSNIEEEINNKTFREDLFYRLNVIPVALPPLRHRMTDIPLLADNFLHKFNKELNKNIQGFTPKAKNRLLSYGWPGNIRELRNLIEREVLFSKSDWLTLDALSSVRAENAFRQSDETLSLQEVEKAHIEKILNITKNNKSEAARILGISRATLRNKI